MAVAVAGDRERVDREYLIAGRAQRLHPQAAVGFDADHHLGGVLSVGGHQLVEPTDAGKTLREPAHRQPGTVGIHHVDVVVGSA